MLSRERRSGDDCVRAAPERWCEHRRIQAMNKASWRVVSQSGDDLIYRPMNMLLQPLNLVRNALGRKLGTRNRRTVEEGMRYTAFRDFLWTLLCRMDPS
jgi:hypothetical protein